MNNTNRKFTEIVSSILKQQSNCNHDFEQIGEEQEDILFIGDKRQVTAYITPILCKKCLLFDMFSWS